MIARPFCVCPIFSCVLLHPKVVGEHASRLDGLTVKFEWREFCQERCVYSASATKDGRNSLG